MTEGPAELQVADDRCIPCQGAVGNLQVLAGQYKQRLTFVAADIGQDDIILGGEVLELAQAGFGPPGFWRMCVDGQWLQIPLIGPNSAAPGQVKAVRSKKKTIKLLVEHFNHIMVGQVRRVKPTDAGSEQRGELARGRVMTRSAGNWVVRIFPRQAPAQPVVVVGAQGNDEQSAGSTSWQ